MNLKGGLLRVRYEGEEADEVINLSHAGVVVNGYDAHHHGEQELTVTYLGLPVAGSFKVQVTGEEAGPKEVAALYISKQPKIDYFVGDTLDLSEGRFKVLYDDETETEHSFTDEGVEITGYDAQKTGRQKLELHYQGQTVEFDVLVSPKAAINDEYLKQEITSAQGRKGTTAYTFADAAKQAALVEKIEAAKAVLENHDASQEAVNQALNDLKQAGADLNGVQLYQTAKEELEILLGKVRQKHADDPIIDQAETLIGSTNPSPEAFANLKEELNKKLLVEESHHVGSLEDEAAPTVEALPELVIETETQAFKRQERPSGDLLLGERRVVQAGVEGQTRRLIEVDAKGNRTLLETEVVKEAVAEITEVGTKVESRVQPLDGQKDLTISNPALVVEEEKVAYGHEERVNPSLKAGERRIVQAGVEGQTRRLIEVDAKGNRTLLQTEVVKEAVAEITEVGTKVESRVQPLDEVKDLTISNPTLVVEEEKVAYGHEERVNPSLKAGERRLVQAGVEGLRRNLVEVDTEGNRSLKGTELIKETVTEIVEIGTKVDVQDDKPLAPAPVAQAAKQEPAKAEAQAEKPEGKQLPSTGEEVDANLLALGLVGVLGGFGLLTQKKKED